MSKKAFSADLGSNAYSSMSMSEESISVPSVVDEIVSDSEDGFSEYSTQSFDPDDMEEAPV